MESQFIDVISVPNNGIVYPSVIKEVRPKIKCLHCGYGSRTPEHIRLHMLKFHYTVAQHKCPFKKCNASRRTKSLLLLHMNKVHGEIHDKYKLLQCPSCNFSTYFKTKLTEHQNFTHCPDKPFTCAQCSESFADNQLLEKHIASCNDAHTFVCGICGFRSDGEETIKQHTLLKHFKGFRFKKTKKKKKPTLLSSASQESTS